jgi:hypothetical protein
MYTHSIGNQPSKGIEIIETNLDFISYKNSQINNQIDNKYKDINPGTRNSGYSGLTEQIVPNKKLRSRSAGSKRGGDRLVICIYTDMCQYIYMYTYIFYVYIYIYIYIYMYVCIYINIYVCIYINIYIYIRSSYLMFIFLPTKVHKNINLLTI